MCLIHTVYDLNLLPVVRDVMSDFVCLNFSGEMFLKIAQDFAANPNNWNALGKYFTRIPVLFISNIPVRTGT